MVVATLLATLITGCCCRKFMFVAQTRTNKRRHTHVELATKMFTIPAVGPGSYSLLTYLLPIY